MGEGLGVGEIGELLAMPIIETQSIHKVYPNGVHANDDIEFLS